MYEGYVVEMGLVEGSGGGGMVREDIMVMGSVSKERVMMLGWGEDVWGGWGGKGFGI